MDNGSHSNVVVIFDLESIILIIEQKGRVTDGSLDPQIAHVLAVVDAASGGDSQPLAETAATTIRAATDPLDQFGIAQEEVALVQELTITGQSGRNTAVRIYSPEGDEPKPILVFFHGGCWVFCDLETHDTICRYLCYHAGCLVVSVDYRLAPENKFPAALEDAYDVVSWLYKHAARLGADNSRIAVGGDSAGGNLAAAVALMARDRQQIPLLFQLLIYPITNIADFQTDSYQAFHTGYFLSRDMMEWAGEHYITNDAERSHPYVSPLLAADLSGLPAAFVLTAESDILRDEGEAYALRLAEAGNNVRATRYRGMVHAFVAMAGYVDIGKIALEDCASELKEAFKQSL